MLHSAAALLKLAELQYAGTTSFFLRVLLDKKYALPFRVIDALVDHFLRFRKETRQLPVVWHQSLLCFVQRYKHEIRAEDKQLLRKLVDHQHHYQIGPEVKRELAQGRSRGEKDPEAEAERRRRRPSRVEREPRVRRVRSVGSGQSRGGKP